MDVWEVSGCQRTAFENNGKKRIIRQQSQNNNAIVRRLRKADTERVILRNLP